jgi:hypothetical protein
MSTIDDFLNHEDLLGRDFAAPSWDAWKVVLKAAFADPLTAAELDQFRALADRDPPTRRVRELWLAIGRRAGKDSIASAIAGYLAVYGDFSQHLRRGEVASILCLACTREQAGIVFGYIRGYFEEIPALKALLVSAQNDTITLSNGVEIIVSTNSFRHVRGKTVAAAIFDEVAFWRDDSSANPDTAIYNAILPSMITLRDSGALIVGISTVHRRSGLLHEKIVKNLGQPSDDILSILAPSTSFNSLLSEPEAQAEIERQLALDPEAASAEWFSRWRDDLSDMYDTALVAAAVDTGRKILFPRNSVQYLLTGDPSGGRGDSFTAAIAHAEGDIYIVDRAMEWKPPFDLDVVMDEIAEVARFYRTSTIYHDDYGADLVTTGFRRRGLISQPIAIKDAGRDYKLARSEIYLNGLAPFTAGRVKIPDEPRLIHQLVSLERRPTASGHDRVDHPPGGHDDLANAVVAAIVLLAAKRSLIITGDIVAAATGGPRRTPTQSATPQQRAHAEGVMKGLSGPDLWRYCTSYAATFGPGPDLPATAHHRLAVSATLLQRSAQQTAWRRNWF